MVFLFVVRPILNEKTLLLVKHIRGTNCAQESALTRKWKIW